MDDVIPPTPPAETPAMPPAETPPVPVEIVPPVSGPTADPGEAVAPLETPTPPSVPPLIDKRGLGGVVEESERDMKSTTAMANQVKAQRREQKLLRIVEFARQKGTITNDDVEKLLRVSDATATRYLKQLVTQGKLLREGKQKRPLYKPL